MNLNTFINSPNIRNAWIQEKDIQVYVRRSIRALESKMVPCFDIGSVEVNEESRGKGIFTAFLRRFEKYAKQANKAVFIESILNKDLEEFLIKNGYSYVTPKSDLSSSVYKFV